MPPWVAGMWSTLSARIRWLVLWATLPAVLLVVYQARTHRTDAIAAAEERALQTLQSVAGTQQRLIQNTRQFLQQLAVMPQVHDLAAPQCGRYLAEVLLLNTTYVNMGVPRADGELLCNARPLKAPVNVATLSDITQRAAAAREIEHLAFYDPLTHLPNRRLMMDRLQQAFATSARAGLQGALLCLDLDHFKTLNDTLGHDMGDVLLQQVAQRLTACVREGDTVARLGGDEFLVLLEDLGALATDAAEQAQAVGEKILAALNQPYQLASHHVHSTTSVGAVLFSGQGQTVEDVVKHADLAMYAAKTAGRNGIRFFDPRMQAAVTARAALENDLRTALEQGQFTLHYQVQVGCGTHVVGAEVLIRWNHPARGMVPPFEFIPLAEETGLILPIGLWVLQTACTQLRRWQDDPATAHLQLAVNVSARQFRQADFMEQVVAVLRQTGARPDRLKLELTESLALDNVDDTIAKMNALRALGLRFSMDDFGTGQSSLSYLTRLPLDQLKIDQSFVRNIGIQHTDALIVQTIIGMAQSLGIDVIAEGVETEAQRAFLERHGCTLWQGYLFSRPVPIEALEQRLHSGLGWQVSS